MKHILVIISVILVNFCFSQSKGIHYYQWDELKGIPIDSVKAISLKGKKLEKIPSELLKYTALEYLNLSHNKLTEVDDLIQLKQLKSIDLGKNKLEYFPIIFCQLTELDTIILNRNTSITSVPSCLQYCQKLSYIDLWYTAVESLPIELKKITTLKKIDLTGVQINNAKQEKLKANFSHIQLILSPPCNCVN